MTRLIDADALKKWVMESCPLTREATRLVWTTLDAAPTIEPGRCGECGHWNSARLDDWGGCENPRLCYPPRCFDTPMSSAFGCVLFTARDREETP